MRARPAVLAAFAVLLAAAPCTASAGQRVAFEGYSVEMPASGEWRVLAAGAFDVALVGTRSPTHSFGMTAAGMRVERRFGTPAEFLGYLRARLEAEPDRRRFSDVRIDAVLEPGVAPYCVRAHSRARERAARARGAPRRIEIWNLTCLHPRSPGLAISLVYYERYGSGETPGAVDAHGRRFVQSLRFEERL